MTTIESAQTWGRPALDVATVGVAIPSIPPRSALLGRALTSVCVQSRPANAISVAVDHAGVGATATRNRAWRMLDTTLIAFLDDDDEFLPEHLDRVVAALVDTDADMVFPWFTVVGGNDPFPQNFGGEWDRNDPRQTTITCLWRRDALEAIGGFPMPAPDECDPDGHRMGEDFDAVRALNDLGGRIVHLAERTWLWHHHFGGPTPNLSGRPWKIHS